MGGTNGRKEATLGANVFTAPGKTMVGERAKPFVEALGFDPITPGGAGGRNDEVAEAEALANWVSMCKVRSRETHSISERRSK